MTKNKIYCFINSIIEIGYNVVAFAEDGKKLAGHFSSTKEWAMHDIGINSTWKHEKYREKYPDDYELIWLEETDDNFQEIIDMINKANPKTLVNII